MEGPSQDIRLLVAYVQATRKEDTFYEITNSSGSVWIDDRLEIFLKSLTRNEIQWNTISLDGEYTIASGCFKDWRQIPRIVRALEGGGECGRVVREKDWSTTELGPIAQWPIELLNMVSSTLSCGLPMCCYWGPTFYIFYNDAYIPLTRAQHPRMFGMAFTDAWPEISEQLQEPFDTAFNGGHVLMDSELLTMWYDNLQLYKESYYTWSFPHVRGADGHILGLNVPIVNMTPQVVQRRRSELLQSISYQAENVRTLDGLLDMFLNVTASAFMDISFSILFTRRSKADSDSCPLHWELYGHRGPFDQGIGCASETWNQALPTKFSQDAHLSSTIVDLPPDFCQHVAFSSSVSQGVRQAVVLQYAHDFYLVLGIPPTDAESEPYSSFAIACTKLLRSMQDQIVYQDLEVKRAQNMIMVKAEHVMRKEAEEYAKRSEEFIDMVCHEIRNPINSILHTSIYVCDILETPLPDYEAENTAIREARRADIISSVKTIIRCATHQTRIANDVLEASKIDMDRLELVAIPMQPEKVIKDLFAQYRAELEEGTITTDLVLTERAKSMNISWTIGDPQRLLQILINLLSNAIKFTKQTESRHIEIHLDAEPDKNGKAGDIWLHFSVRDSGVGLTPQEQQMLFARFSQASSKTFNDYGGSGLGLYISKKLVEMQRGKITIYSNPEKENGTQLNFSLASAICSAPTASAPKKMLGKYDNTKKLNVLILEDNPINRNVLARIVTGLGHTVTTGNDGLQGLQQISSKSFDIVLCDCEMPNLDGLGFTRRIRSLESKDQKTRLPIIAVTGNVREQQVKKALDAGMDSHIAKPYSRDDIHQILSSFSSPIQSSPSKNGAGQGQNKTRNRTGTGPGEATVIETLVTQMRLRGQT